MFEQVSVPPWKHIIIQRIAQHTRLVGAKISLQSHAMPVTHDTGIEGLVRCPRHDPLRGAGEAQAWRITKLKCSARPLFRLAGHDVLKGNWGM